MIIKTENELQSERQLFKTEEEFQQFCKSMNYKILDYSEPNIELACEVLIHKYQNPNHLTSYDEIVRDYPNWVGTGAEEYLTNVVYDTFGKKGSRAFYKSLENYLKPVSERKFHKQCMNDYANTPFIEDFGYSAKYVYVVEETEGKYGKQFWVATNCENGLSLTKTQKQLNESLEVGHFYKIQLDDVVYFGNNRKKFVYDIKEITETEWIQKGMLASKD